MLRTTGLVLAAALAMPALAACQIGNSDAAEITVGRVIDHRHWVISSNHTRHWAITIRAGFVTNEFEVTETTYNACEPHKTTYDDGKCAPIKAADDI
ncbi:hypothetical protein [Nonomuraea sp. NEAU-A123]|uniref:hypothetical protein n=1 Tax=Nonomuraea sp. NEAU-A123 TaxID=2839649 RepID=UPI001BE4D50C|nr:hypothetical protein [Nonomuraea sp. NEAU-A123]MBT2226278.1 hypothetical protein [Nonomuraea sp. NEAU-A123]